MNNNISPTPNNTTAQSKKKRKFNFIDFLIVLLIASFIALLVYAFSPFSRLSELVNKKDVELTYVVELRDVSAEFIDLIKANDNVINANTKNSLGTVDKIYSIEMSTVLDHAKNEDGIDYGVLVPVNDRYDITLYITASAEYEEGVGYSVEGCRVAVGEELNLRFPNFVHNAYCVALDVN